MIKTKTPRHWGGGIRQVSPPMITSRLSNKRGGRTNGWKDYSRSRKIHERVKSIASKIHYQRANFWLRCNTFILHNKCRQHKCVDRCNDLFTFTFGRQIIFNRPKCYFSKSADSSLFCWHCSDRIQQRKRPLIGDILRLTLKGVA